MIKQHFPSAFSSTDRQRGNGNQNKPFGNQTKSRRGKKRKCYLKQVVFLNGLCLPDEFLAPTTSFLEFSQCRFQAFNAARLQKKKKHLAFSLFVFVSIKYLLILEMLAKTKVIVFILSAVGLQARAG